MSFSGIWLLNAKAPKTATMMAAAAVMISVFGALNGNLLVGVWKYSLIVRLGPEDGGEALLEPHVKAFDITGRPMKGWVLVEPEGVTSDDQLKGWIERAVKFVGKLPAKER